MMHTRRVHKVLVGLGVATISHLASPLAVAQQEVVTLQASDFANGDKLGDSVAIDGDYAIGGADLADKPGANDAGAAYIFVYDADNLTWVEQQKLQPGDLTANNRFGFSVAISGDVAVVGAPQQGTTGAVYIFRRSGTVWTQEGSKFVGAPNDRLGTAVAIDGNRILIGADQQTNGAGTAYILDYSGGSWGSLQPLPDAGQATGQVGDAYFGGSVTLQGDLAIVGAREKDVGGVDRAGAVYVFLKNGGSWTHEQTLTAGAGDENINDRFGSGVSFSNGTLAVGAPGDDEFGSNAGAVYTFTRSMGGVWGLPEKMIDQDWTLAGDALGTSVSIDDDALVAGAAGSQYASSWQRVGGAWQEDPASPVTPDFGDDFGRSVAISGPRFVVGASGRVGVTAIPGQVGFYLIDQAVNNDSDSDGLSDDDETNIYGTDPGNPDTDGDTLSDGDEVLLHDTNPLSADSDADGSGDAAEIALGTDPNDADTDNDGLNDGDEAAYHTDPHDADSDNDGLDDGPEVALAGGGSCPNPLVADSDGDSFNDGLEQIVLILNPCDADTDHDGIADGAEAGHGTNPNNPDTDGDGLLDGQEVTLAAGGDCPSPTDADSDDDGLDDGDELTAGSGPCDTDSDNDGLNDANEVVFGTDPNDTDSDNDGMFDGAEVDAAMGSGCPNPLDPDSDNDTLPDGAEVTLHTSLCNPDTDGDGLLDGVDPQPLIPAMSPAILACMTLATAGEICDTPTSQFLGPNNITKQARRATLAAHTALAAVAISRHQYAAARALLTTVDKLIDGSSPPPDWMVAGSAKTQVHSDVQNLLTLLDLID